MTDQLSTVAVVIPLYNRAQLVLATLESVVAQQHPASRVVVVDDGSTDGGAGAVEEWAAQRALPFELVVYRQANGGVGAARNAGIERIGDASWVMFLDSDDLLPVDLFARQLAGLADTGAVAAVATTNESYFDADDRLLSERLWPHRQPSQQGPLGVHLNPQGVDAYLISSDVVRSVGGFDTRLRHGEDKLFLLQVACLGAMVRIDGAPVLYRCYAKQLHGDQLSNRPHQNSRIRYAHQLQKRLPPLLAKNLSGSRGSAVVLWKGWHRAGKQLEVTGHWRFARDHYGWAISHRPFSKSLFRWLYCAARAR